MEETTSLGIEEGGAVGIVGRKDLLLLLRCCCEGVDGGEHGVADWGVRECEVLESVEEDVD